MISPSTMTTANQQQLKKHHESNPNELSTSLITIYGLSFPAKIRWKWCALILTAANTSVSPFVHQYFMWCTNPKCCAVLLPLMFSFRFWGPIDEKCWLLPWWKWFRLSSGSMHINWRYVYFATGFFGIALAGIRCMQSKQSDTICHNEHHPSDGLFIPHKWETNGF